MLAMLRTTLILAALAAPLAAPAATVVVLTSFPSELTNVYKAAYEAGHPGVSVDVIRKSTEELLATLEKSPKGSRPDVVWASDPAAFATMAQASLLRSSDRVANPGIPKQVGLIPMNGPDGLYLGQAVSGYGLMWNTEYLRRNHVPMPFTWADLTRPAYFDHVSMSSPLRSGTTHLTVEVILQAEGWDKGWAQVALIAGNAREIATRSTDVPAQVKEGLAGVGLVVDFFGLAAKATGAPVDFAYPKKTVVLPASIGLVAGARNAEEGERFVRFALSNPGQELLYDPKIRRMPASPFAAASMKVPPDFPNVYAVARKSPLRFDLALYEGRRALVAALFDRTITQAHAELRQAARAVQEAERRLEKSPSLAGTERLRAARAAIGKPLLSEAQSVSERGRNDLLAMSGATAHEWTIRAKENYLKAAQLAAGVR